MNVQGGIYKIQNTVNGKRYIGSAVNLRARKSKHWGDLHKQKHHNRKLQNAWNKYGEAAFEFVIMLVCDPVDLISHEQIAIDGLKPEYNIAPTAGSALGVKRTPEFCAGIGDRLRGKVVTEETKAKLRGNKNSIGSNGSVGNKNARGKRTPAQCVLMSLRRKGKGVGNQNARGNRSRHGSRRCMKEKTK